MCLQTQERISHLELQEDNTRENVQSENQFYRKNVCSCRGKTTVVVFLFLVSSHPLEGFSVSKNYIMHYKTFKQYKIFAPHFSLNATPLIRMNHC